MTALSALRQLICAHKYSYAEMNVINTSKTLGMNPKTIGYLFMDYVITCDKCGATKIIDDPINLPILYPKE